MQRFATTTTTRAAVPWRRIDPMNTARGDMIWYGIKREHYKNVR